MFARSSAWRSVLVENASVRGTTADKAESERSGKRRKRDIGEKRKVETVDEKKNAECGSESMCHEGEGVGCEDEWSQV